MSSTPESIKQEIKNWVLRKNSKVSPADVEYTTPLLEKKIISSLHVMELILYLEKLSGKKLKLDQLKPAVFQNIETIYSHFFPGQT